MLYDLPGAVCRPAVRRCAISDTGFGVAALGLHFTGDDDDPVPNAVNALFAELAFGPPRCVRPRFDRFGSAHDVRRSWNHHQAIVVDRLPIMPGAASPETSFKLPDAVVIEDAPAFPAFAAPVAAA